MTKCMRAVRLIAPLVALLAVGREAAAHGVNASGARELDWQAEHIRAVTSVDVDARLSGLILTRSSEAARVEERDGRSCVVGDSLLFDVDDAHGFDLDETVTLDVTLDRTTTNGLLYYYDHAERRVPARERRLDANDERWTSVRLVLERARLSNRLLRGTDFALAALGSSGLTRRPGDTDEIAVCGLRVRREGSRPLQQGPKGGLRLVVREAEDGPPTPVRVGLYDERGRLPRPSERALGLRRWGDEWVRQVELVPDLEAWPHDDRFVFFIDGRYEAELEAGRYELVVGKGPEFRVHRRPLVVEPGKTTTIDLTLPRWIDMPASGWYSSDDHVHFARERADDPWISTLMRAEDVHVANVLQMGNLAGYAYPQYAFGSEGRHVVGDHALVSGQESPRTMQLGHAIGLDVRRYHRPDSYFLYDGTAKAVHEDGGLFGYAHANDGIAEAMNTTAGLALDVARGHVDFIEIMQGGQLGPGLLYDYLNLGFRLTPSAGTDWPYIGLPGAERMYVRIRGDEFSVDGFFAGLKAGRVFVTNGPLLELEVDGRGMGSEVRVDSGERVGVRAVARQSPDLEPLERLELIVHGEVVHAVDGDGTNGELSLEVEIDRASSAWLAVRAHAGSRRAHSAPVYLVVDGDERCWKREAVPAIVERIQQTLARAAAQEPDWAVQHEKEAVGRSRLRSAWDAQKEAVGARAREASRIYESLLEDARRER